MQVVVIEFIFLFSSFNRAMPRKDRFVGPKHLRKYTEDNFRSAILAVK